VTATSLVRVAQLVFALKDVQHREPRCVVWQPCGVVDAGQLCLGPFRSPPEFVHLGHERVVNLAQAFRAQVTPLPLSFEVLQVLEAAIVALALPLNLRPQARGTSARPREPGRRRSHLSAVVRGARLPGSCLSLKISPYTSGYFPQRRLAGFVLMAEGRAVPVAMHRLLPWFAG
jgi:hypothetical protein